MISDAWEEYAKDHKLDAADPKLRAMFEWAWHSAVNECCGYLQIAGQIGVANQLQDYMRDDDWEYEEEE